MYKNITSVLTLTLLFCKVNVISQEWTHSYEYPNAEKECYTYQDIIELQNGYLLSPTSYQCKGADGGAYTTQPAVSLFSDNGAELARNNFFRPGYCTTSNLYVFENNGIYALTTYSPEHTIASFNYFMNYDNPPADAILGLYKLDDNLNVLESYEHSYPIDTFEARNRVEFQIDPNGYCGNIVLFSAFEDEGYIVGSYFKSVSLGASSYDIRGNDSLFFFRMNFDGEIVLKKGFELNHSGGGIRFSVRRNHIVKADDYYILYELGNGNSNSYYVQGTAKYYDKDFNFIKERYLQGSDCDAGEKLENISVIRSNQNTTYLSTQKRSLTNPDLDEDNRLYEIDDDINASSTNLEIINHIDRGTEEWDHVGLLSAVDITDDNSIYYTYSLNNGYIVDLDSWIVIEHLDNNLDTISTLYYGIGNDICERVFSINVTEDGDVVIVHDAKDLNSDRHWNCISKFPASAFVSIEEAHAYNLHLAVAYPNPGGDVMNIRTSLRNCTLHVYDMQGRLVHQQEITDDVTSVDASNWQRGTYVWELGAENGNGILESGKWVK